MEKKATQRIVIGLISLSLLALIGLNIYEYKKFRYIPPTSEIKSSETITINNNSMSAQATTSENIAKYTPVESNYTNAPQNEQIAKEKNFR
jgi:hypothetical protein